MHHRYGDGGHNIYVNFVTESPNLHSYGQGNIVLQCIAFPFQDHCTLAYPTELASSTTKTGQTTVAGRQLHKRQQHEEQLPQRDGAFEATFE